MPKSKLEKSKLKLVFLGPQGSGKGTQAELLSKKFKLSIIETGKLLRLEISKKTKLGLIFASFMNKGNLVPDQYSNKLMDREINKYAKKGGFIIDGYPRNKNQLEFLDKKIKIDYAILINLGYREAIRRLSKRRGCPNCGRIYHLEYKPPKNDSLCDKCKARLDQRDDDKSMAIRRRLKIYNIQTAPLVKYFQAQNKLISIDGDQSIKDVFKEILKEFNSKSIVKK